jgi:F-type H+-transporting ATPase subunit a
VNQDSHATAAPAPRASRRNKVLAWTVGVLAVIVAARFLFPVPLPHIQLPAETLAVLPGNFGFTNTMLAVLTTDALLILFALAVRRRLAMVPSGVANLAEAVVEFWQNQAEQLVGSDLAKRWLPLVLTMFFLIGLANWSELIPGYDTVGLACHDCPHPEGAAPEEHTLFSGKHVGPLFLAMRRAEPSDTEHPEQELADDAHAGEENLAVVPFYRAAATDLNFTIAMALIAFTVIQFAGFRALGVGGYLGKFFNFKEGGLGVFVGIVEFISELSRIISFAFRLFGNVFAGQVLLFVIPFLLPFLVPVPVYGLELFVGLIQAYVFAVLTLAFMAAAVTAHQHESH